MLDTTRIFKLSLEPIQRLSSRLSVSGRLVIIFILGLVSGSIGLAVRSEVFNTFYIIIFVMALAVGLTIKLSKRSTKIGAFFIFLMGVLLVVFYPYAKVGLAVFLLTVLIAVLWIFIKCLAIYVLSAPESYFNYFYNVVFWALIFIVSWLTKSSILMDVTIISTVIVKIYQLILTKHWITKDARAYIFSVLLPSALAVIHIMYIRQ